MELLNEIWSLIFREHLPLLDVIRCRLVSKRFKFLVDHLHPTELFVYHYSPEASRFTDRYERESTRWMQWRKYQFHLEANSSFQIMFSNLRFLQLETHLDKKFNLEIFNEFAQLEQLYLNSVVISRSQTLKLPKLKVLSIELYSDNESKRRDIYRPLDYDREPRLVLDCKLEQLIGARSTLLQIKHPECVQHLEDKNLCRFELKLEELISFKNLRILYSPLTDAALAAFPFFEHLQELHLDRHNQTTTRYQLMIDQLLSKRRELKRDIKIYFAGILVTELGLIECLTLYDKLRFYHLLADRVPNETMLQYSEFETFVNNFDVLQLLRRNQIELNRKLPVDFFDKFANLKWVYMTKIDDPEWFVWFLSRCRRLAELSFKRESLTQPILNRLPVACRHLTSLSISDCDAGLVYPRLDLSPLYDLKQLCSLSLRINDANPDGTFDLGILFENCRYLTNIHLTYILIQVNRDGLYDVYTYREEKRLGVRRPEKKHPGNNCNLSNLKGTYRYTELKSSLNELTQECQVFKEFQEAEEKSG